MKEINLKNRFTRKLGLETMAKRLFDEFGEDNKEILLNRINDYVDYFTDFGECNNSIIVSGSLDYLSMVLEKESSDLEMKNDLLELLSKYVLDVKKIYDLCDGNPKLFEHMNLNSLEIKFNSIQDYISQELGIFPRLYDSEFEFGGEIKRTGIKMKHK